jgi:peptidoglycan-associated lipoprotein
MSRNRQWFVMGAVVMTVLLAGGCRKQQTTLDQTPPPPPPADTAVVEAAPPPPDTTDDAVFREAQLEAELQRKVNEILKPVHFEFNSYQMTQESIERLVMVSSFLTEYGTLRVLAEGHCDERGSSDYNMGLGENRSKAVREYIVNYGIGSSRVETTSYGKERPVRADCADEGCHGQNRRVEFKVLGR